MFDACVVDMDAPSYRSRSPETVNCSVETEKKYTTACVLALPLCAFL